jgi:hypothetical protein
MATKRVHEIAKERGITSKEALEALCSAGLEVKVAASKVDAEKAARAFGGTGSATTVAAPPPAGVPAVRTAKAQPAAPPQRRKPIKLKDFIARVDAEQPERLSVAEVARVWPHPWVNRNGSGKRARIRMQVGGQKYERMQGDHHWHWVDHWTMGPPR